MGERGAGDGAEVFVDCLACFSIGLYGGRDVEETNTCCLNAMYIRVDSGAIMQRGLWLSHRRSGMIVLWQWSRWIEGCRRGRRLLRSSCRVPLSYLEAAEEYDYIYSGVIKLIL